MATGAKARIASTGEIGRLIAALDDRSPLGPLSSWSASLTATVDLMLHSRAEIVLFWGDRFCALYNEQYAPTIGTKHPVALGRPASEGWSELWQDLGPLLANVRATGETFHAKDRSFYIERQDGGGEEVFFDISYSPVFDEDGSVGGVLCIVSETTAKVVTQRETVAERDRLWTIARDPFLVADKHGVWLNASPAWTEILGWTADELTGRTSQWMEHPDDVAKTRGEIVDLAGGATTLRFENRFRGKDGDYRWFSWTAVPEGDLLYCVARDVTPEREAEAALREAEDALRHAQKMETVGQLTGGVAHDFNNLLQVVAGNLDIVLRNVKDDQPRVARAANNAMAGVERAAVLTQRLLAFSRRQPLAPKRLQPDALIGDMADLLRRTLGETVELDIRNAAGTWPIEVDANQLENAILNLAVNARDAMPKGGRLTVETSNASLDDEIACQDAIAPAGDHVLIRVSDTGTGMDAETLAKAFDPFFTTKEVGRGTGLGLSMVYGFIRQSGGQVRIGSVPGQGTEIRIYLPRVHGPVDDAADHAEADAVGADNETILVCEDDEAVRAYTTDVLRELGYRVIEAGNGAAALAQLDRHGDEIDLLFTDVILPGGMTGADLARSAQAMRPDLRILFTTGYARDAIVHDGRLDPGVFLLQKPFKYTDLATKLREMLDR